MGFAEKIKERLKGSESMEEKKKIVLDTIEELSDDEVEKTTGGVIVKDSVNGMYYVYNEKENGEVLTIVPTLEMARQAASEEGISTMELNDGQLWYLQKNGWDKLQGKVPEIRRTGSNPFIKNKK